MYKTFVLLATVALSTALSVESWALNIDFEKELKKREIVSVRLADDLGRRKDANSQVARVQRSASNLSGHQEDLDLTPDRETESFSVQLKLIRR